MTRELVFNCDKIPIRGKSRSMNQRSSLVIRSVINGQNVLMLAFILLSDVREIDVLIETKQQQQVTDIFTKPVVR